ncbi:HAD family hydrolase [Evansella tamaricis]|uniref:HAD-IA family hydrolase n=1 Tax=Evansella tamaricis TaxID=2069301 RepID=A0ABS6JEZ5_9BACI|nr:HAD-IA family hydrolase [Evansella tamaricis]
MWKGICFDLDNTLFDHEEAFERAIHYCYHIYLKDVLINENIVPFEVFFPLFKKNSDRLWKGLEERRFTKEEYRRARFNETMETLNLPSGMAYADQFHTIYFNVVDEFCEAYPGLPDLFSFLTESKVKLGIVTNGMGDTQYNKLKQIGAEKWIPKKNVIVSEEVGIAKPDKEIFQLAEHQLSLAGEELLYVGDSWQHDVLGAMNAGWDAIFLNTRQEKRSTNHEPIGEYHTLDQVREFMVDIFGRRRLP